MLSLTLPLIFIRVCFSNLFSIVITSLGRELSGLYVSCAFVILYALLFVFFSSVWCRGLQLVIVTLHGLFIYHFALANESNCIGQYTGEYGRYQSTGVVYIKNKTKFILHVHF